MGATPSRAERYWFYYLLVGWACMYNNENPIVAMVEEKVDTILEVLEDEFRDFTALQYADGLSALRDRIDEMIEAAIEGY